MKNFLEEGFGNASMMRKLVWILTLTFIVWGTAEITTYIWLHALDNNSSFEVHTNFLLAGLAIVLTGKVTQKSVESRSK